MASMRGRTRWGGLIVLLAVWSGGLGCDRTENDPPDPRAPADEDVPTLPEAPAPEPRPPLPDPGGEDEPTEPAAPDDPADDTNGPRYPLGRLHSPITGAVAEELRRISRNGPGLRDDVFMRIGDSNSVNPHYLACFTDPDLDLGDHGHLEPTLVHFLGGDAHGASPFAHQGEACRVSQPAFRVIEGSPSPLEHEVGGLSPRFALVMIGTNDVLWRPTPSYARDIFEIVDQLINRGVVPLLSTIPPRAEPAAARTTARSNAAVRAIAEARRIPLLDLHAALNERPGRGLRDDGVHLTIDWNRGDFASCHFDDRGMRFAMNLRNLLTLEQLDRAKRVVVDGEGAFDAPPPTLPGDGSPAAPFEVDALPFSNVQNVADAMPLGALHHQRCDAPAGSRGHVYRLEIERRVTVRVMAISRDDAPTGFRLVSTDDSADCVASGDDVEVSLEAGRYDLVLDVLESGEEDELLLLVVPQ
jgi:hypothetical protein